MNLVALGKRTCFPLPWYNSQQPLCGNLDLHQLNHWYKSTLLHSGRSGLVRSWIWKAPPILLPIQPTPTPFHPPCSVPPPVLALPAPGSLPTSASMCRKAPAAVKCFATACASGTCISKTVVLVWIGELATLISSTDTHTGGGESTCQELWKVPHPHLLTALLILRRTSQYSQLILFSRNIRYMGCQTAFTKKRMGRMMWRWESCRKYYGLFYQQCKGLITDNTYTKQIPKSAQDREFALQRQRLIMINMRSLS